MLIICNFLLLLYKKLINAVKLRFFNFFGKIYKIKSHKLLKNLFRTVIITLIIRIIL